MADIRKDLKELLQKSLYLGLGAMAATRERAEKLAQEWVKRGEMSGGEAERWVKGALRAWEKERKVWDRRVQEAARVLLDRLNVPSRSEFERLRREVARLRKAAARTTGPAAPARRPKGPRPAKEGESAG